MTVEDAIKSISYELRGTDDDAPSESSAEWLYWVNKLNRVKNRLYKDVTKKWSQAYAVEALGTVVSASTELTLDLPATFIGASNDAYVVTTDNKKVYFDVIKPEQRNNLFQQVFVSGSNPQTLIFTAEIEAGDDIVGGTVYVPGFYLPADYTANADTLVFPDDEWAIVSTASEIAFSDIVYEDKAPDLNAKANELYKQMTRLNRKGTYGRPTQSTYNTNRINRGRFYN